MIRDRHSREFWAAKSGGMRRLVRQKKRWLQKVEEDVGRMDTGIGDAWRKEETTGNVYPWCSVAERNVARLLL